MSRVSAVQYMTTGIAIGATYASGVGPVQFPTKVFSEHNSVTVDSTGSFFTLRKHGVYRFYFTLPTNVSAYTTLQFYSNGLQISNTPVFSSNGWYNVIAGELWYKNKLHDNQISLQLLTGSIGSYDSSAGSSINEVNGTIIMEYYPNDEEVSQYMTLPINTDGIFSPAGSPVPFPTKVFTEGHIKTKDGGVHFNLSKPGLYRLATYLLINDADSSGTFQFFANDVAIPNSPIIGDNYDNFQSLELYYDNRHHNTKISVMILTGSIGVFDDGLTVNCTIVAQRIRGEAVQYMTPGLNNGTQVNYIVPQLTPSVIPTAIPFPLEVTRGQMKVSKDGTEIRLSDHGLYRFSFTTNCSGSISGSAVVGNFQFYANDQVILNSPVFTDNHQYFSFGELLYYNRHRGTKISLRLTGGAIGTYGDGSTNSTINNTIAIYQF